MLVSMTFPTNNSAASRTIINNNHCQYPKYPTNSNNNNRIYTL